ncbi:FHA domain-containing protein [Aulosira sp. FACHB-615]|uniref:FHA domain-containing protein n=1 Tax=Aulosira sp. FACHB-615 TaxID=2692777 RepID=UPI0016873240|nr:FHA domain-containing protein [Aulosira sp. FACHB-615]MBD2492606.1 FHA domain-containing protein [Aulosira sp. FACHB-615]
MYSLRLVVTPDGASTLPLRETCTIGRHSLCRIKIVEEFISRWHCALIAMPPDIECDRPYFIIKDGELLGKPSANGTWVNSDRIRLIKLKHQDIITFSQFSAYPRLEFLDNYVSLGAEIGTDSHERVS